MKLRLPKYLLQEVFSGWFLVFSGFVALLYLIIALYSPNYKLLLAILHYHLSLVEKISALLTLFVGSLHMYSGFELAVFTFTAVLVGMNMSLSFKKFSSSSFHMVIGGESVLGFLASGCTSCGAPILSFLSSSLGIGIAPFQMQLLQLAVITLLAFSFVFTLTKTDLCPLPTK